MATNSRNTRNSSSSSSGDDYNSINSNRTSSSSKSSLFDDLEIKQHIDIYGTCKECQYPKTSAEWCRRCSSDRFREKFGIWSSGNKDIDNFISNAQMTAIGCSQVLEWIPWERFSRIKHIGLGRFGSTYSALWIDGYITHWDSRRRIWGRCDFGTKFVIKIIHNSSSNISDFLNELISHKNGRSGLIRCYGITQHPITRDYALVIRCIENDFRSYLYKEIPFPEHDWKTKLEIIADIALVLHRIHESDSLHRNFHTGNILRQMNSIIITELNISTMGDDSPTISHSSGIYGVLPYIAPEMLRGGPLTKSANIYSLGIIMWEIATQRPPFDLNSHDKFLAQRICCGLRPHIDQNMPKSLAKLIKRCWDANIENRPEAEEVYIWVQWWLDLCNDSTSDIAAEFNIADQEGKLKDGLSWIHPEAIYTTRHLEFQSLPEPENFSPETYHNMVAFCARIHHTDDMDCHLDSEITDIFAISSQFSRRPSTFLNGSIASTPTNTSKESLLYRMPGAYIGSVSDGIDNTWKGIENAELKQNIDDLKKN
ncbi:kinase-like domain-containing protein [Gigaspora rosea]|uniref:Kinase-like domain-containing protein n=1 Tax=Gigaspora rosea TaxID=44941 RepID=A0A397UUP8_9GLOM|nr:kinase-like domain-containing protein [Gigaspora rosea]